MKPHKISTKPDKISVQPDKTSMKPHKIPVQQVCLALLSGGLLSLAFPKVNIPILAWIGLVPLFFALGETSPRSSFFLGWSCGLTYFGGTLYWVIQTMTVYGHVALWQSMLIFLALVGYLSLYIGVFAALWNWLRRLLPSMPALVIAPVAWTALEFLRGHLLTGFPWSILGYSQYSHLRLIQFADTTGVYGVSFLLVLVNAGLASIILQALNRGKRMEGKGVDMSPVIRTGLVLLFTLGLIEGYGEYKMHHRRPQSCGTLTVGIIQADIPQEEKWDNSVQDKIYDCYQSLTLDAARQKPDVIIWPEASTPFIDERQGDYMARISPLVRKAGVPMVIGSPRIEVNKKVQLKNSAFLLSPDGKILDFYDKIHLVPFGEYLPLKQILSHLGAVVNQVGEFSAGDRYTVFHLNHWRFGLVICYELIFPDLFRKFARQGVNFMVNITNDAWFGRSSAPYQHFSMAVFRAIENGISVVRVANTGISGFIDPLGRVVLETPLFQRLYLVKSLDLRKENTFYVRYGDLFAKFCLTFFILLLILGYRARKARFIGPEAQRHRGEEQ